MKYFKLLALVAVSALLYSCSSSPEKEQTGASTAVADCVFPQSDEPAPGWVCDEPVEGLELSAVGIAPASKGGLSLQKDIAAADGRGRLVEQLKVEVDKMVKQYLGSTGVGDSETIDRVAQSTVRTVSSDTLRGSKVYKTRTGPNGEMYVLVGLNSDSLSDSAETAVNTSMGNDEALWQQFQAERSFEEMSEAIGEQR